MTLLHFGRGWKDSQGRERDLIWLSDTGWLMWADGTDVLIVRAGLDDEIAVRTRLLGWEDYVDDPAGPQWVQDRIMGLRRQPRPYCVVCQGEGWYAGPDEGVAVPCACGDDYP